MNVLFFDRNWSNGGRGCGGVADFARWFPVQPAGSSNREPIRTGPPAPGAESGQHSDILL